MRSSSSVSHFRVQFVLQEAPSFTSLARLPESPSYGVSNQSLREIPGILMEMEWLGTMDEEGDFQSRIAL